MPRVFISRRLQAPEGPFARLQKRAGWQLTAQSLLTFQAVPLAAIPPADWLFFYSRQGVIFFLQQAVPPTHLKLATMGPATARQLAQAGYQAAFIGTGKPTSVAADFLSVAQGQRVLFVQAQRSRQSVQQIIGQDIKGHDLVVYNNVPRPWQAEEDADYLIFTSPLNFETYLGCNRISQQQRLIAIGTTTAQSFQQAGFRNYRIAKQAHEAALLSCLLEWQNEAPV